VGLEQDAATPGLRIVEQSWAPGLGWFPQRSVAVADDELDDLIERLQQARSVRGRAARRAPTSGRILPFRRRARPTGEGTQP
jgi:hypothetical protein